MTFAALFAIALLQGPAAPLTAQLKPSLSLAAQTPAQCQARCDSSYTMCRNQGGTVLSTCQSQALQCARSCSPTLPAPRK